LLEAIAEWDHGDGTVGVEGVFTVYPKDDAYYAGWLGACVCVCEKVDKNGEKKEKK